MEQESFESNCKTQAEIRVGYGIARILFVAIRWLWKWLVKLSIVYQMLRKLFKRFSYVDYSVSGGYNGEIDFRTKSGNSRNSFRCVFFTNWTSRTEFRILFLSKLLWYAESLIKKETVDNLILTPLCVFVRLRISFAKSTEMNEIWQAYEICSKIYVFTIIENEG